ncbi:MAG: branched-chain amino acid ABC transporter permease [Caldilineae bacterium]|nr:MAG: branched-chain amino acid ABC transporter permease [Caldilineae bacterium]
MALPFILFVYIYYLGLEGVNTFGTNQNIVRLLITMVAIGSGLFAMRAAETAREQRVLGVALGVLVILLPFVLNQFQNSVMGIVFIFVMMGLGLNIVVGFAGLLDLGYVAFFAIGAYVYAFVSAPFSSPWISQLLLSLGISPDSPLLGYWSAIPLAMITAAIGGVLLGVPVLRLRGDYLAIVTLGFGEIIRLFMLNLGELTNGPRGLLQISQPTLFGMDPSAFSGGRLDNQGWIFLLALLGAGLVALVASRLNDSRLGRAWIAMREDEDVAQATGIHLVQTKLLAFAFGAMFAGLAGQLYAARQINIFPENFTLFVSIDALSLIIVGGMGSLPGVVLGALALKGLPEVLRGVDEYRIVTFAALLVIMMIVRPEGILPSARRQRELEAALGEAEEIEEVEETSVLEQGIPALEPAEGGND